MDQGAAGVAEAFIPLCSAPRGVCTQAPCYCILMEFCAQGQLYEVLRAGRPVTLDETGPPGAGQVLSSPTSPGCTPKRGQAAALQAHPSKGTRAGACPWGP